MFQQLTIIAPGLLGASLGQAAAAAGVTARVLTWARRPEVRIACEQAAWCHASPADPVEALQAADLVVLCTPVGQIVPWVERIAAHLPPGAIVTDVGSTKSLICRHAHHAMPADRHFVGSHPMAGSEQTGMEHARPDLFVGRPCFVTPLPESDSAAVERVVRFWDALQMRVTSTSPERHDEIVAAVSHLPHMVASTLCLALRNGDRNWAALAGNGLRDTTRIAAGSPALWRDICQQNREEILRAMRVFETALQQIRGAMENEDFVELEHLLELGRQYRNTLGNSVSE